MQFPYGTAALALLVLALGTGAGIFLTDQFTSAAAPRPDLVVATFAKEHAEAYAPTIRQFEKDNNCTVQLQLVNQRALQGRLQSAMQVGAEVPDMVEILGGTQGTFVRGPVEDLGFIDLTDRIRAEGLYETVVSTRFPQWATRGHQFGLPHDVHPVMLAYRKDIVEALGIDVAKLTTWDEFCRVGREVTKDLNGDGVIDRYMIDLPPEGSDALRLLMLQNGAALFDEEGNVNFDNDAAAKVLSWYARQTAGPDRISFPAGWGQNLARSMMDGLCVFYLCPDWRTGQFKSDVPGVAGKMGLIPLPAWEQGGIRTSTWGGTGLAITKQCKRPDLAWKLAMALYFDPKALGPRFAETGVLPPLKDAWSEPAFSAPDAYFSGIPLGQAYASLADEVPVDPISPFVSTASAKMSEAFQNVLLQYREHGDEGLEAFARQELKRCADRVRVIAGRNVFLKEGPIEHESDRAAEGTGAVGQASVSGIDRDVKVVTR